MDKQTCAVEKVESEDVCKQAEERAADMLEEFDLDDVEVVESKVFA